MDFLANNLSKSDSKYLLQHKENPIFWQQYCSEVIEYAKKSNKPVLLSIGYSSCHWCHVMESESFSSQNVADFINENFVCIKLDKEEFPDVDNYFQRYAGASNGSGGWPLNIFLNSDFKPFFAGTYFPMQSTSDIPSFLDLSKLVLNSLKENNEELLKHSSQVLENLSTPITHKEKIDYPGHFPSPTSVLNAIKEMQDNENGGYGDAPKFAQFAFLEYAVEQILEGVVEEEFAKHILESIEKMMMGGLYDHVKGGIHRYSTDKAWAIPHFEKMLYDQAGLLSLLSKTALIMPSPLIIDAQIQTLDYLETEMLSDNGYLFSAQDADSEGEEGLYFTYTYNEIKNTILSEDKIKDDFERFESWTNITPDGNFHKGLNCISFKHSQREEFFSPENWNKVRAIKSALLSERKVRIPPMTDNKGIASWNFQAMSALVNTLQYSKIDIVQKKASDLLKFLVEGVHKTFINQGENTLDKSTIKSTTISNHPNSLFENYVFFCEAQFKIYDISGNEIFLNNALDTLKFIHADFFKDNTFFVASTKEETIGIPNIEVAPFDQAFGSSYGVYLGLVRKYSLVDIKIKEILNDLTNCIDNTSQLTLSNPIAFGQCLRALTYPLGAYKKVELPLKWLKDDLIQPLLSNLSSRFIIQYTNTEDDQWQICNFEACELEGKSFEEFSNIFSANK